MLALLPALMLASMPAQAEPVGNLRSVAASASGDGVQGWDLQTDKGARIRIELPATDIIRVQAGRNGTLTGAGDKAAPIVLPQPKANVKAQLEEDAQESACAPMHWSCMYSGSRCACAWNAWTTASPPRCGRNCSRWTWMPRRACRCCPRRPMRATSVAASRTAVTSSRAASWTCPTPAAGKRATAPALHRCC